MSARGLFITGTDTGVGKTVVSVALLHALRASGKRTAGMKPLAAGCIETSNGWRNDDALALQAASDGAPDYATVNPCALPDATAPQLAAQRAGITVCLPPMIAAYASLASKADVVVVEGVGGWLAPLADGLDQGHLAKALAITEVILVVGLRLGCINHARLSERAILADGFMLAGWVGNAASDDPDCGADYFEALRGALRTPCLGQLAYTPTATAAERAACLQAGF